MSKEDNQARKEDVERVLVEEVEEVTGWEAKPLSLAGTARLIHLLAGSLDDAAQRMAVQGALSDEAVVSPVVALVRILDENKMAELLAIITGKSKNWVTKNWNLKLASTAIRDFIEREELGEVLGNLGTGRDLLLGALAEGGSQES